MPDIKIKVKPRETIKSIDKSIVGVQKIKNNLITTKEKINEMTIDDEEHSGEEYAGKRIQNDITYTARKGIEKGNEIGKKSFKETQQNFVIGKQKVDAFKSRIKEKRAIEVVNNKRNELEKRAIKSKEISKILYYKRNITIQFFCIIFNNTYTINLPQKSRKF